MSYRITLRWEGEEIFKRVFALHGPVIARETLSNSISFATLSGKAIEVADLALKLEVTKE